MRNRGCLLDAMDREIASLPVGSESTHEVFKWTGRDPFRPLRLVTGGGLPLQAPRGLPRTMHVAGPLMSVHGDDQPHSQSPGNDRFREQAGLALLCALTAL